MMTISKSNVIIRADGLRYDAGTKTFLGLITELSLFADVPEIIIQGSSGIRYFRFEIASSSCLVYCHDQITRDWRYRLELYEDLKELEERWISIRNRVAHDNTAR